MYYLYGYDYILKTLNSFLSTKGYDYDLNHPILIDKYNYFLLQNSVFDRPISWSNCLIVPFSDLAQFASKYYIDQKKKFKEDSIQLLERLQNNFFYYAFIELNSIESDLFNLCHFLIKLIVTSQLNTYTNGTTNETLGLSIFNFKDNFTRQDFIELIIHQLTHMLYFIADRTELQMSEENKQVMIPTNYKFVLGGRAFPAYLAFHSFVVAVEVLKFRHVSNTLNITSEYHGSSTRIKNIILDLQIQLLKHDQLFTKHGRKILYDNIEYAQLLTNLV